MYTLDLAKESFKFAAAHFAIFGPACAERLHGHNYYVRVSFKADSLDPKLGLAIEFNQVKPSIIEACEKLNEYVLIPEKSPYLKIEKSDESVTVYFAEKKYVLPKEDVHLVPLLNISCEELSKYLWEQIKPYFEAHNNILELNVEVEETRGQKASYGKTIR